MIYYVNAAAQRDGDGSEQLLECDTVVTSFGVEPDEDLIKAAENAYAWKTIRVIINAASENPRLDFTIE